MQHFELKNAAGMRLTAMNFGATLTGLWVPDRNGNLEDVVLGFDEFSGYDQHRMYLGATAGRVANRIDKGQFLLDGQQYQLDTNDPPHHLHGGVEGWDRKLWQGRAMEIASGQAVEFRRVSPGGEAGYPGKVEVGVTYSLTDNGCFGVLMWAQSDRLTPVNLAHHTYWNLGGNRSGTILDHRLSLSCDEFTPGDPVPTGRVASVVDTPFDFRETKSVGSSLKDTARWLNPSAPVGFDHNWIVRGKANEMRSVAVLEEPVSGRRMALAANVPGVQFYSGNFLDGSVEGKGRTLCQHAGLCLETQAFPNAINVPDWSGQVLLAPGQLYRHEMQHQFSVMP